MLLPTDSGEADSGRGSIREQRRERPWVLMRNHAGNGPRSGSMFRGKRRSTLKEMPASAVLVRTFAPEGVLECFHCDQAVQCGFTSKKASLAPVLVMSRETE